MKFRRNRPDARSLRSRAGRVDTVREAHFEALEERKLLFSISITPDMDFDGDGIGTATATFGYTVPYLENIADVADAETEDVAETFNDELPGSVPNRFVFLESDVRVTHSFGLSANFRVDPPDDTVTERYLQVNAVDGSFMLFEPMVAPEDPNDPNQQIYNRSATRVSFTISDPDNRGLTPNDFVVDLFFFNELIDSFTADELLAANQSGSSQDRQRGIGTFVFDTSTASMGAFTGIRIRSTTSEDFRLDDLSFTVPTGQYADMVESRVMGADLSFTGPIGSSVQILDLYGEDMQRTIALGRPDQLELTLVDLDDDGVPNFNDGLGKVVFTGVDSRASFAMFGGTIAWEDNGFVYTRTESFIGLYDTFEDEAGFGYHVEYDDNGDPTVFGLPGGPGSLVFGSPYVRNNTDAGTYLPESRPQGVGAVVRDGFSRPDQGVFVSDGQSIGSVYIHGVMHGSSQFSGAVNELYFGTLLGSVTVEGDLGTMYVGSDAGFWISDDDAQDVQRVDVGSQLSVGRTAGEIAIGGRSDLNVAVGGDLSNAQQRPPRDPFRYVEREKTYAFTESDNPEATIMSSIVLPISDIFSDFGLFVAPGGRSPIFNSGTLRNDTIMGAEFVGSIATAVQVSGTIGFGDPINGDEDPIDVFAFVVDGLNPVAVQFNTESIVGLVRIMDQNGRTLAATEVERGTFNAQEITFQPPSAGVYYVVVSDVGVGLVDTDMGTGTAYIVTIAGLAPTVLGSYRTAGSSGHLEANLVNTLAGDIGMLRIGTGFTQNGAAEADPTEILNDAEELEDNMDLLRGSFSAPGNLYAMIVGSDIVSSDLFVGGDLGLLAVGMSPVVGGAAGDGAQGDVAGFVLSVGGRIADMDIKGSVGVDQDEDDLPFFRQAFQIRTGVAGGDGSIGRIRIGSDVAGGRLLLETSPGSVVGQLLISQDKPDGDGIYDGDFTNNDIRLGFGSDIRFVDFPRIDILNTPDHDIELIGGQSVEFVDDGGGVVRIQVDGVLDNSVVGHIRFLPVDNAQGVAIARIDGVDLTGGRTLRITSTGRIGGGSAPISIGSIEIIGADALSGVQVTGNVEVDVWRVIQSGGEAFNNIRNLTPNGDYVAVDVIGVDEVQILTGDLGRTQVPEFGPQLIGPYLGVAIGEQGTVGAALGVDGGVLWAGDIAGAERPVSDITGVYLDDIGMPFDGYLNGLAVRTGSVSSVLVGGAIGDVILQGGGEIVNVLADNDMLQAKGDFDGIVGTIYAGDINRVDVGSGLAGSARAPSLQTGIFATDEIRTIVVDGLAHPGAFLSSVVIAANNSTDNRPNGDPEVGGVGAIVASEADLRDLYIGAMNLDDFRTSYAWLEGGIFAGTIGQITGLGADIFRSDIEALIVNTISLTGGAFDASVINAGRDALNLDFGLVRNSTLTGTDMEFHDNSITVSRNLRTFAATDVSDLTFQVAGNVIGSIGADNFSRVVLGVNNTLPSLLVAENVTASEINAGRITAFTIGGALRTSVVGASGPLTALTAGTEIYNSEISVTGPQGELGAVTADTRITGTIRASGPIGSVTTTTGDIIARIVTTTDRGTVDELNAGRDLIVDTNISASVGLIQAGRHIGSPSAEGVIFVNGGLPSVVAGGHLFSDIRVGKTLDAVTIGAAVNRPGAPMGLSGSLFAAEGVGLVTIAGDYGGEIVSYTGGIASVVIDNGSLLATGRIAAYDGDVQSVVINGGNLYGDIHSSWDINSIVINPSGDGVFGDVGVNPGLSAGVGYDAFRGQLPPGTLPTGGKDGPVISADRDIDSVVVAGGSVYEATIHAGRTIGSVDITGGVFSDTTPQNTGRTVFAAGDLITGLRVTGNVNLAQILAGVRSLGDDMDAGGFGADADSTQSGSITGVSVGGNFTNSQIAAGMDPGADRLFNTADDKLEIGSSSVGAVSIGGSTTGSSVYTDTFLAGGNAGGKLAAGGYRRPVDNSDIAATTAGTQLTAGTAMAFSTSAGTGTILFTGPGSAFFDAATNRVILHQTTTASTLVVHATGELTLTDFDIVSTEGASMGVIRVEAARSLGDSDIVIDENVTTLQAGGHYGTGDIVTGTSIASFSSGRFAGGTLSTRDAGSVTVHGVFGDSDPDVRGEALMSFVTAGSVRFVDTMQGALSARYSIGEVTMDKALDNGLIRAGEDLGTITAASINESRISSGNTLASLDVAGDVFDSSIMIGGDLGDDAEVGGTGFDADGVSAGFLGAVSIGGDFTISDIVAGYLRGPDGFFGTSDDRLASGRSAVDSVAIGGTASGSNRSTESYRIASTGTLGAVTEGGLDAQNDRNLVIEAAPVDPLPIQVVTLDIRQSGRLFAGEILFNQAIDLSSLAEALSVSEVRGSGDVEIRLIQGHDYTIAEAEDPNAVLVRFDASVTERDLPRLGDQPGPGVYRFEVLTSLVRAAGALAELDGDGDGRVSGGENFSQDTIIGDAGDKLTEFSVDFAGGGGFPPTHIDFYSPINLDVLLDDNLSMNGLPEINDEFLVRGTIGDHPDNTSNYFSFASDTDIYSITLQAGQILRLGGIQGAAFLAGRTIVQPDGQTLGFSSTDYGVLLPTNPGDLDNQTPNLDEHYLIRQTGTYHIVVGNTDAYDSFQVPNIDPVPGGVGEYWFTVEVFDDGDSGFSAGTTSGDGQNLVNAPAPIAFAGADGRLGTADDLTSITQGAYRFIYSAGADGAHGTADDIVSGTNGSNVSSATNGLGTSIISVDAAIGNPGSSGLPDTFSPDVDIFHLNAGNTIDTGTVIKVTLKLSDLGSDLGSRFDGTNRSISLSNYVQFAIFDTTTSTASDDALLVFAPDDVSAIGGGTPGAIAESTSVSYGFDDNGDFYIEFAAPGRMDLPGEDASYAIYVQGVTNSDYRVEVVTGGSREVVQRRQNILLETGGGSVDWLEVGGVTTPVGKFVASSLGFTGNASNGQPIDEYLVDRISEIMQGTFDDVVVGAGSDGLFGTADDETGLDVHVSADPNDFEFQDFSTVFVTSTLDPISPIFAQDGLFVLLEATSTFSTQPYGVSEHADAGNADRNDEAILFIPSFTSLGYTPSDDDVEGLAQSLAAAATRRVGELMGLRLTENYDPTEDLFDIMAANSVVSVPGDSGEYELPFLTRRLSSDEDSAVGSDFFLGFQNTAGLLSLFTRS